MTAHSKRPARRSGDIRLVRCASAWTWLVLGLAHPASWAAPDGTGVLPTDRVESNNLHVEVTDDLVTLSAWDAPVRDILKALARESGLLVNLHGSLELQRTMDLSRVPLPVAVKHILRHQNYAFRYARKYGDAPSKLWVLSDGPGHFRNYESGAGQRTSKKHARQDDSLSERTGNNRQGLANQEQSRHHDEAVAEILEQSLADDEEKTRFAAVAALSEIEGDQAIALLINATDDESPRIRAEAVNALGERADDTVTPILQEALRDVDALVRQSAVDALTHLAGDGPARALSQLLDHKQASVREEVVMALGIIGGFVAIRSLRKAIKDRNHHVREAAIDALAEIGGEEAVQVIVVASKDDEPSLREQAMRALEDLGYEKDESSPVGHGE